MKYIKKIILYVMIVSLNQSLLFASSTVDGQAFVTKEEFDKALADFNMRLNTFEAGINSKIDSQISTYLARNGIWNGSTIEWDGGVTSKNMTWADMGGDFSTGEIKTVKAKRFTGVAKKDGLAFISLHQTCTKGSGGTGAWRPYVRMNSLQWCGFETMIYLSVVGGQYDDSGNEEQRYANVVAKSTQAKDENVASGGNFRTSGRMIMHLPSNNVWVLSFFVEKGPLWVGIDVLRVDANSSSPKLETLYNAWCNNGTVNEKIDRAFIY